MKLPRFRLLLHWHEYHYGQPEKLCYAYEWRSYEWSVYGYSHKHTHFKI